MSQNNITLTPDNIGEILRQCATKEDAFRAVMQIRPEERENILGRKEDFPFLDGAPSYATYGGRFSFEFPLIDTPAELASMEEIMARNVSEEDAIRVYEELFRYIANEMLEARKEGKQLTINMGEGHTCKGSYTLNRMMLDIGKRLGVEHLCVEGYEKDESIKTLDGRNITIPGIPHGLQRFFAENAENGILPETHPQGIAPEGMMVNSYQLVPEALAEGLIVAPIDLNNEPETPEEMYDQREKHMARKIEKHVGNNDTLVSCGAAHLDGFESTNNRRVCSIDTTQSAYVKLISATTLPERFKNPQAFHPRFQTGIVHSFAEGKELAQAASRAVGDELEAEFKAKLAEISPTMSSIDLGGRSPSLAAQKNSREIA